MSKLTKRGRNRISSKNFIFPRGTKASKGEPKFPIHTLTHARAALSRAGQKRTKLTKTERCKVVQKVCDKFPTVGLCKTNTVSKKSLFAKCNGVAVATKKKGTIRGTFRTAAKKAAPKKKAAAKKGAYAGRWKPDPRGGVSRSGRSKSGATWTEWSPFGPPSKKKHKLYLYKPANRNEGVALMATSEIDAHKKLITHCREMKYRDCDLSKLRRATKAEIDSYAKAYWD